MPHNSDEHHDSPRARELLNVHALMPHSRANGPGLRAVIWLQGCPRRCPGCFNPESQAIEPRHLYTPDDLWQRIKALEGIEGLTLSGGEPLLQAPALVTFLRRVRSESNLSVVLYSGYRLEEIQALPYGSALLALVDTLIDGPYDETQRAHDGIRGSANQRIHFLTDRYTLDDFTSRQRIEIVIQPDGTIVRTGVGASRLSALHGPVPPD